MVSLSKEWKIYLLLEAGILEQSYVFCFLFVCSNQTCIIKNACSVHLLQLSF